MTTWRIERIYEEPFDAGSYRILADRLRPRGISKKAAYLNEWCKGVAPGMEVRHGFGHGPIRFGEFKARYRAKLAASGAAGTLTERLVGRLVITLLYATHDPSINQAVVLQEALSNPQVTS